MARFKFNFHRNQLFMKCNIFYSIFRNSVLSRFNELLKFKFILNKQVKFSEML